MKGKTNRITSEREREREREREMKVCGSGISEYSVLRCLSEIRF